MVAERKRIEPYLASAPDKTVAFVAEMDMGGSEGATYLCLPDASRGGQLEARPLSQVRDEAAAGTHDRRVRQPRGPRHGHGHGHGHHGHASDATDGIEWEDDMVESTA